MGPQDKKPRLDEREGGKPSPDDLDEQQEKAVIDSFPASDPPSNAGITGPGSGDEET